MQHEIGEFKFGAVETALLNYKSYWGSLFYEVMSDGSRKLSYWTTLFLTEINHIVPNLEYLVPSYSTFH